MGRKNVDGEICLKYKCHHCCNETEMLLTKKDIHRIVTMMSIPAKEFVVINNDGYKALRNKQTDQKTQCYFLDQHGLCIIYEIRPEGCQFYPFIWDMIEHRMITDDYCPHENEFKKPPGISKNLEEFIFKLFGKL